MGSTTAAHVFHPDVFWRRTRHNGNMFDEQRRCWWNKWSGIRSLRQLHKLLHLQSSGEPLEPDPSHTPPGFRLHRRATDHTHPGRGVQLRGMWPPSLEICSETYRGGVSFKLCARSGPSGDFVLGFPRCWQQEGGYLASQTRAITAGDHQGFTQKQRYFNNFMLTWQY